MGFAKPTSLTAKLAKPLMAALLAGSLASCANLATEADYPDLSNGANEESGSFLDNFSFFKDDKKAKAAEAQVEEAATQTQDSLPQGLAVNSDLWRAALVTIRFMPLAAADPMGGTIITDWYNDPGAANERVKINIVLTGLELRADALRVSIFREKWRNNRWTGLAASPRAERQMENIILTRARDFALARRTSR